MTSALVTPVSEEFTINQNDPGVARDLAPDLNLAEFQDLWRFQVPVSTAYVFKPEHTFSLYLEYLEDNIDLALADDGGSFTDETTAANEATANDMTLMPATETTSDQYYFGKYYPFGLLRLVITTLGVGTAITWEYPATGAVWTTIPGLTDGTTGLTVSPGNITFEPPADWIRTTIDGKEAYYIRAQVSTASYTTVPVGDQGFINTTGVAVRNSERFRIEVRDASEETRHRLVANARYNQLTAFTDITQKFHLPINEPIVARERFWIVVMGQPRAGILDVSTGYFQLRCTRVRKALFPG